MTSLDSSSKRIPKWISEAITNNTLSHAYIVEGDELSDKAVFSMELTKAILCQELPGIGCDNCITCRMISQGTYRDVYYVSQDERSVKDKDIEELQERLAKLPMERSIGDGGRNIAIINNADTMTIRAQNRLLKTLEEPYPGTVIFLLSENSDNLLPTVKSRCQIIRLYDYDETDYAKDDINSEVMMAAQSLINMARNKNYFFEIKALLEKTLKDRGTALALLDAMERVFRDNLRSSVAGEYGLGVDRISFCDRGIKAVEKARNDIKYNIREKYALSEMMLKIGGIHR